MKYSAKETILDIIFNPVTFLLVCVALFVSAGIITNHHTYESTKKKKCERSAEWIICPEIRFLASDVNRVSIIKKTDFDAQNLTVELRTRTLQVKVANGHLEETLQVIKEAAKEQ